MRYLSLLGQRLQISATLAMQYRSDFLVSGALSMAWTAAGLVPFHVAFHQRPPVAGWSYDAALVVVGWFTLLRAVLDGAVNPSLLAVVNQIREGTLDFVLLKPADAQFLVSTSKFEVFRILDIAVALGIVVTAFVHLGHAPSALGIVVALFMFAASTTVLYSIWLLVISAAFWVVRVDNLAYLFDSIFDFARWPVSIFKGVWKIVFTFIIPLGVMTTYPAEALLGTLHEKTAAYALIGAVAIALLTRFVFRRAIAHYTSASS